MDKWEKDGMTETLTGRDLKNWDRKGALEGYIHSQTEDISSLSTRHEKSPTRTPPGGASSRRPEQNQLISSRGSSLTRLGTGLEALAWARNLQPVVCSFRNVATKKVIVLQE